MIKPIPSLNMIRIRLETFRRGCARKGFCFTSDDLHMVAEAFIDDFMPDFKIPRSFFSSIICQWHTDGLIENDGRCVKSEQPAAKSRRILVWKARA
jgi:hypothetical protein